ncbi:hypothetical protein FE236_09765 [Mariprofundus erugo]|uniref:MotE family protein n=1 Tax=Mariprofundus erugo TaxID=2528639 RepID=UPI0010FE3A3D|nr:hypothetical protein [Mariprofundus erugo]TLS75246.1 hypothetical protein FE236_09765 [Mariprofundus erugo]
MSARMTTLFLCITLLLAARAAMHLAPADDKLPVMMATQAEPASPATAPAVTLASAPTNATTEQPKPTEKDPLAMLETYLIPEATAGSSRSDAPAESSTLPVDDKTLSALRAYKESLDKRQGQLEQREQALVKAEEKLQQRVTELEQLEASIKQRLNDEQGIKTKKIKRLTSVYEGMKADKAAPVIAQMDLETVVKLFTLMDEKQVGKILSFMPAEKAVVISQALTRQISTVK